MSAETVNNDQQHFLFTFLPTRDSSKYVTCIILFKPHGYHEVKTVIFFFHFIHEKTEAQKSQPASSYISNMWLNWISNHLVQELTILTSLLRIQSYLLLLSSRLV